MKVISYRGKRMNARMKAHLLLAERYYGAQMTIVQGAYNPGGVAASAGTHDSGGCLDFTATNHERKVKALRKAGWAAWYRPAVPGLWGAHVHAVSIGDPDMGRIARNQVTAYRGGRDGLAGNRRDTTWRPSPIPEFKYPVPKVYAINDWFYSKSKFVVYAGPSTTSRKIAVKPKGTNVYLKNKRRVGTTVLAQTRSGNYVKLGLFGRGRR